VTDTRLPLPGPLTDSPALPDQATAVTHLDTALARIRVGAYDREAADNVVAALDRATVAAVASWMRRSYEAGVVAGRAERVDESAHVQRLDAQVEVLRAEVARLRAEVDDLRERT
jgi:cell division protein FtsB